MSALIQQSNEWLELRKNKIGASDAPVIMHVSPWKTPYQLWEEKLGLKESFSSSAMKRGLEMEESARKAFEKETGLVVFPQVLFHKEHEWMMASVDGIDIEGKNIVEIKCPGKVDHEIALSGNIPEKYFPQLQHQMAICELDKAYYFSYSDNSSKVIVVNRDESYIKNMICKEVEFYDCVQNLTAPRMIERDFIQKEDDIWIETAAKWKQIKNQMTQLEKEEEDLRSSLICMSGKSNCKGGGIKLSKIVRKGSIDYKAIPELKEIDLEKYRKTPIEMYRLEND